MYQQVDQQNNQFNKDWQNPPQQQNFGEPPNNDRRFRYEKSQYRDKTWMIAFYIHIFGMFAIAILLGKDLIKAIRNDSTGTTWNMGDLKSGMGVMVVAAVTGTLFGFFWMKMMRTCKMINLLYIYLGFTILSTLALFTISMTTGLIGVFFLAITLFWFYCVRSRIPFSEAILKAATQSLTDHNGAISVSFVLAFVQVIWVAFWFFTTMAVFYRMNPPDEQVKSSGTTMFFYFLLLVSLYWTSEVVKNVGHVTTAGTVASWWLIPASPSPTVSALRRSLTTSFGSICFGSLLVALIKAIREILYQAERQAREQDHQLAACILCCARCCLGCIESMMEYFNVYAYTHVAIYGDDYLTSAKAVKDLFKARGFTLLINDDLTGAVLGLGCLLSGIVSSLMCGLWAAAAISAWTYPLMGVGFIVGIFMCALVTNPVSSAIATTFVCWAEDPEAMGLGRPSYFKAINDAAQIQQPSWNN